ncbi:MAG: lipase family protein [Candidatus Omnitrophica bacterium]|nr:lipase family protein [Candidatus Omnitrophota bacterium]
MSEFEFKENTTRFSLVNALQLAKASALVYKNWSTVARQLKQSWGFPKYKFFDIRDTEAFVAVRKNIIILAFRGTQTKTDWQTDFNIKLVKSKAGRVHRGFKNALSYVWKDIKHTIRLFQNARQTLWVTGHSLGGALATLAVDRLTDEGFDIHGLYTFGQPRVGDRVFARRFNRKIKHHAFRFVNDEDIVTRVPPRAFGYRHIGTVRYFDYKGTLHKDNIGWKRFLSYSESATARSLGRYRELKHQYPNGIADHSMNAYIRHIRTNLIKERGIRTFKDYLHAM